MTPLTEYGLAGTEGNIDIGLMSEPENFQLIFEKIRENETNVPENCSSQSVLKYLNLTKNKDKYTVERPVKHYNNLTWVLLEMKIYAILDVEETEQKFIAYIWVYLRWDNEFLWWYPEQFCGIEHILVPTKFLWMPDLTIVEKTEADKASPSPYLNIRSHGWVEYRDDQVVVSTCKMHVYRFPFDRQSCNISFKSIMYSDKEIELFYNANSTEITEWSRTVMRTQYEWLFDNMKVTGMTVNDFGFNQTMIVYTINMKRRSVLYTANFLLPIIFFLCLDFASMLISDTSGEKIGFKITILLAVTVMQLILNDILPCSSDRIPLIAVYCIGTFALMLLSLLETILVIYLIDKDASQGAEMEKTKWQVEGQQEKMTDLQTFFIGLKKCRDCTSVKKTSAYFSAVTKEGENTEVSLALEKMSDDLGEIKKSLTLLSGRQEDAKPGYWTRTAKKINKAFAIFYVTAVTLFLGVVFTRWFNEDD